MYLYEVGYSSMEECPSILLGHERKYTKEDFQKLVILVTVKVVEQAFKHKEILKHFSDAYEKVANALIQHYGFCRVKPDADFIVFGWPSMFSNEDWKDQREDLLIALTNALNKIGYDEKFLEAEEKKRDRKFKRQRK